MKILVLTGSPHKDGTSAYLADNFVKGAKEAGHEVVRFDTAFMSIAHCAADEYCHTQNNNMCGISDDMDSIYPHLKDCDRIVFATPIHYNSFSSQLRTAIGRIYCMDEEMHRQGKASLILTYAEDMVETAVGAVGTFRQMLRYWGWEEGEVLLGKGVEGLNDLIQTDYPARAYLMGRNIK